MYISNGWWSTMKIKHYLNLTNGMEYINEVKNWSFIRIQSSHCESHSYDRMFQQLDSDFLMNLAIGNVCIVYDKSNKTRIPKALSRGVEIIRYVLNKIWFDRRVPTKDVKYHNKVLRSLQEPTKTKLKYFRKFLLTEEIHLLIKYDRTTHDGDYPYYKRFIEGNG